MNIIVLVAHGSGLSGAFSNAKVKIITQSGQPLTFTDAKAYMGGTKPFPEFASSSLGTFSGLSDADCTALFGKVSAVGPGFVDTGNKVAKTGNRIFALRGGNAVSFAEVGVFAKTFDKVILLACRS